LGTPDWRVISGGRDSGIVSDVPGDGVNTSRRVILFLSVHPGKRFTPEEIAEAVNIELAIVRVHLAWILAAQSVQVIRREGGKVYWDDLDVG
jgi:response regulator of citrate/malate metabolism